MITRIVKMTIAPEKLEDFLRVYGVSVPEIRKFNGCNQVELLHDVSQHNIVFTYSRWDSVAHLDAYRNSDFFAGVWKAAKQTFAAKAEAWSLENV
jgi:quinol monooxygenase YgiN